MKRLVVASLLFAAAPLAAQTFPTDDPVIKRIYSIGMDSSRLTTEAHVLFDSLGPRLMGTPNIKRAQDWLVSTYKSWGVDAKQEQYGTWRGWERGHSHIDLVSPRRRTLQGQMVGYSPGTGGQGCHARDHRSSAIRRQHRVREVAAEGEGQARHDLRRIADVPAAGRLGSQRDAGVQGAHGLADGDHAARVGGPST